MASLVHVLINAATRGAKDAQRLESVVERLRLGCPSLQVVQSTSAAQTEQNATELVADGAKRLVVVGGDGMVHLAIQAVAQTDTVLGIVALGTGNDFARGVGLPDDLDAAATAALGPPTPIDLMRIGQRWAASVATAGFSVAVNQRANTMRRPTGPSKYSLATLLELPRLESLNYQLTVDGTPHDVGAVLLTVANTGDFGGGMRITPGADPTDGVLNVTIVGNVGRLELLRWFRKVFSGTHLRHPRVSTLHGATITVAGANTQIWADGEPVAATPVTIEAVAGALLLAGAAPTRTG